MTLICFEEIRINADGTKIVRQCERTSVSFFFYFLLLSGQSQLNECNTLHKNMFYYWINICVFWDECSCVPHSPVFAKCFVCANKYIDEDDRTDESVGRRCRLRRTGNVIIIYNRNWHLHKFSERFHSLTHSCTPNAVGYLLLTSLSIPKRTCHAPMRL